MNLLEKMKRFNASLISENMRLKKIFESVQEEACECGCDVSEKDKDKDVLPDVKDVCEGTDNEQTSVNTPDETFFSDAEPNIQEMDADVDECCDDGVCEEEFTDAKTAFDKYTNENMMKEALSILKGKNLIKPMTTADHAALRAKLAASRQNAAKAQQIELGKQEEKPKSKQKENTNVRIDIFEHYKDMAKAFFKHKEELYGDLCGEGKDVEFVRNAQNNGEDPAQILLDRIYKVLKQEEVPITSGFTKLWLDNNEDNEEGKLLVAVENLAGRPMEQIAKVLYFIINPIDKFYGSEAWKVNGQKVSAEIAKRNSEQGLEDPNSAADDTERQRIEFRNLQKIMGLQDAINNNTITGPKVKISEDMMQEALEDSMVKEACKDCEDESCQNEEETDVFEASNFFNENDSDDEESEQSKDNKNNKKIPEDPDYPKKPKNNSKYDKPNNKNDDDDDDDDDKFLPPNGGNDDAALKKK